MTYELWHQCRALSLEEGLSNRAVARRLGVDPRTVKRAVEMDRYQPPARPARGSMLDPWKGIITGRLQQYPELKARRLYDILAEDGCPASYSLVKRYVAEIRPRLKPVYRVLTFLPGECAQVDWGCWKSVEVEGTQRRLNFFVMVLGHSRLMYAELTLAQSMEHWLTCHRNAFTFFGGVPEKVMVDNCRTAVQEHRRGCEPIFNNRYLDFASWYGFTPVACAVRRANEKGQVENGVGYIRKSFFPGRELVHFPSLQSALSDWVENVANKRTHRTTGKMPRDLFEAEERSALQPMPELPCDCSIVRDLRADTQFRVSLDTNRYSVPAEYASCMLTLRQWPDRIELLHDHTCVAQHVRSYGRRQDIADPAHEKALLTKRRHARLQKLLCRFLRITPQAERYCAMLRERRADWHGHVRRIVALAELHGDAAVAAAIEDANHFGAWSSDYIENILDMRSRAKPITGALHLTRKEDMLELPTPRPNLELYEE